jgi:hypothetical protein
LAEGITQLSETDQFLDGRQFINIPDVFTTDDLEEMIWLGVS